MPFPRKVLLGPQGGRLLRGGPGMQRAGAAALSSLGQPGVHREAGGALVPPQGPPHSAAEPGSRNLRAAAKAHAKLP